VILLGDNGIVKQGMSLRGVVFATTQSPVKWINRSIRFARQMGDRFATTSSFTRLSLDLSLLPHYNARLPFHLSLRERQPEALPCFDEIASRRLAMTE
jgi:hypothetical protein